LTTDTNVIKSATLKEEKLRAWAKSPSQTEIEKCERAERMVKLAIEEDPKLSKMDISVYAKGSYANRTNIPSDSDVDIAVVANHYYFNTYPEGMTHSDFNFSTSDYFYHTFKQEVARAIEKKFGVNEVTIGDKCIKVRSNSCRVDADVVPHFVHRRFARDKSYHEGVAIRKSDGTTIYNWPQDDYDNAVLKNENTGKRYKALVRVLKNIKCEMKDQGYASAEKVPSYLIACLVWNVPDGLLSGDSYEQMTMGAIDHLIGKTATSENVKDWGEVNELKYLFRVAQAWKLNEVNQFLKDAKQFLVEM
jgi:predicted nucleotidyltransferase